MSDRIPLTNGGFVLVSPDRVADLSRHQWRSVERGGATHYAIRQCRDGGRHRTIYMHRVIIGALPGDIVDHINRDGLDNRDENLRLCNASLNQANKALQRNNTSGFRGVRFHSQTGKYCADIKVQGKRFYLGIFVHAVDAAAAYDKAALAAFGEFARLNLAHADAEGIAA